MGFLIGAVDEVPGNKALAHQPALHVDDAGKHGIDRSVCDGGFEFVESHHPFH